MLSGIRPRQANVLISMAISGFAAFSGYWQAICLTTSKIQVSVTKSELLSFLGKGGYNCTGDWARFFYTANKEEASQQQMASTERSRCYYNQKGIL